MKNNNNYTPIPRNLSLVPLGKAVTFTGKNDTKAIFPLSNVSKFPILLDALMDRIKVLQESRSTIARIFDLSKGKPREDLKDLGGVYVLWCSVTGLFYVGSALRFFSNEGRLNDYYMAGRVNASLVPNKMGKLSSKVSKDLAKTIKQYGITSFHLIIVEEGLSKVLNKGIIQEWEQFWMSLEPTLNRSLVVGSNDGAPISEDRRRSMSNVVYQYEVLDGLVLKSTEAIRYGLKDISRTGIIGSDGKVRSIHYETIHKCFHKGRMFHNFVFLRQPISKDVMVNEVT